MAKPMGSVGDLATIILGEKLASTQTMVRGGRQQFRLACLLKPWLLSPRFTHQSFHKYR